MDTPPTLRNWRVLLDAVLLGQVSGHPDFRDGAWIVTSALFRSPDLATGTAWTQSRLYLLEDPWPADRPMPEASWEPLVQKILHRRVFPSAEQAAAGMAAAERIAQKLTAARRERENDAEH